MSRMPQMIFIDPQDHQQFVRAWDAVQAAIAKQEDPVTMLDVVAATMLHAKAYEMRRACEAAEAAISQFCVHIHNDKACRRTCGSGWESCVYVKLKRALADCSPALGEKP